MKTKNVKTIFNICRESILSKLENRAFSLDYEVDSELSEHCGMFVTIHKHGNLRGCIGLIRGVKPIHEAAKEMAQAAAFEDPRFNRLAKEEFDEIDLEISILTPFKKLDNYKDVVVGKHGLYISKGFYSGLLLPQVATEYKWTQQMFLEQTCFKAGLDRNSYKEKDCEIFVFEAEIHNE